MRDSNIESVDIFFPRNIDYASSMESQVGGNSDGLYPTHLQMGKSSKGGIGGSPEGGLRW